MNNKKTLVEIFNEIGNHSGIDLGGNDKGSTHSYLETYDKLFEPFRNGCNILEIGLATGDSVLLWDKYFENSVIVGVDLSIVFSPPVDGYNNEVRLISTDATTDDLVEKIKHYTFSIVVEDSSHMEADSIKIFNQIKPYMAKGSIYIVEDVLNLDASKERFKALHLDCEIFDFRNVKGRFDDCLIVYRF